MATALKITKSNVDALVADAGKPAFLWDMTLPGFGVKCSGRGVKSYVVKYRANGGGRSAKQRWLTLGRHGKLTPDQARKLAQQVLAAVARGEDPQGERVSGRNATTLADVWARYTRDHLPRRKPRTRYDYERQWDKVISPTFGQMAVHQISRSDVDRCHKRLRATPYRANRVLALLSRLMTLAEVWEHRPAGSNPCRHVERFSEKPRSRYLSRDELVKLGEALQLSVVEGEITQGAANAVRLLLFTGARLTEVLSLEWSWVDYERNLIALPDSKSGAKPIFLNDAAVAVLKEQAENSCSGKFVFPGDGKLGRMVNLRKPWTKLCARAGLDGVRLHDLRHTVASVAVGQGASLPVIGRLLGHSQAQTTQRYAHVDADPALVAANAVGQAISSALEFGVKTKSFPEQRP